MKEPINIIVRYTQELFNFRTAIKRIDIHNHGLIGKVDELNKDIISDLARDYKVDETRYHRFYDRLIVYENKTKEDMLYDL